MGYLKSLLVVAATGYLGIMALMYVTQRSLMYHPEAVRTSPADAGFPEAKEVVLDSADGEHVIAWHVPPRGEQPVVLYFHGNGGALRYRVDRFRGLTRDGTGLVALSYRGYAGSSGHPSEDGILADAAAAYAFTASRYPASRIAVWGESLGSGVAVAIASEHPVGRLVLEAPYLSTVAIAAGVYPWIPVRVLMKDQFRSDLRIGKVTAPVLVLHGERDTVIPIASGEALYSLIKAPKRFVRFPAGTHEDLGKYGAVEVAKKFINEPFE